MTRYATYFYESMPPPAPVAADVAFSFTATATITLIGGDVLVYQSGEVNPLDMIPGEGDPFDTASGEGSPLVLIPTLL